MTGDKRNTVKRKQDNERFAKAMADTSQKKKDLAVMLTNSFVAGLEAGQNLEKTAV